jgi:hypothetical protein
MEKILPPKFDDTKGVELIYDHHGVHLMRINSTNANEFLDVGRQFDFGLIERLDSLGRTKAIFIADKSPPLSALLSFVQRPVEEILWGVYAVILPKETSLAQKFIPIVAYGMNITGLKNKYTVKVYSHKYRDDWTEIYKWLDANMTPLEEGKVEVDLD